ncbi:MAG: indole-3-glycerol phosphate synthase TrpC [Actinomycetota bacterium]|nr:indole-3-glycerol phosphate synthase TrpC [Actinomycetota bacterium]
MPTYLDRILTVHRVAAAADLRPIERLVRQAEEAPADDRRGFRAAIEADRGARGAVRAERVAVIAEIKRRSPSQGDLAPDLSPDVQAKAYQQGGAACLSVLTDREFFGGSSKDLVAARAATGLPALRKDFTVGPADVCDARLMGADAVLLIVTALSLPSLRQLVDLASHLGLDALVEVHDEVEVEVALAAGATLIGVNQRDLVTFEVDTGRAERLAARIPDGVIRVAESGIAGPDDARRLAGAGYHAVLVGEALVRSGDPASAVAALRGV